MSITPPINYIPEFCQASISNLQLMISESNNKFIEIKSILAKNDLQQINQNEKLVSKIEELEKLYQNIDKEIFKVKGMSNLVGEQSKINVDFSGNFKSIEKRIKIIFTIIFLGVSGFITLLFILLKIWLGMGVV